MLLTCNIVFCYVFFLCYIAKSITKTAIHIIRHCREILWKPIYKLYTINRTIIYRTRVYCKNFLSPQPPREYKHETFFFPFIYFFFILILCLFTSTTSFILRRRKKKSFHLTFVVFFPLLLLLHII